MIHDVTCSMTLLAQKLYEQAMSDEHPRVTKGWVKKCILHPYL